MKHKITIYLFLLSSFLACVSCQNCESCLIDAKKDMPFFEQINEKILEQARQQLSALSWQDIQQLLSEKELNTLQSRHDLKQITYTFNGKYTEYVLQHDKKKPDCLYYLLYFGNEFDKNNILNDVPYGEMQQDFMEIDKNWVYISILTNHD